MGEKEGWDYIQGADKRYALYVEHRHRRSAGPPETILLCPRCLDARMFALSGQVETQPPKCVKCPYRGNGLTYVLLDTPNSAGFATHPTTQSTANYGA